MLPHTNQFSSLKLWRPSNCVKMAKITFCKKWSHPHSKWSTWNMHVSAHFMHGSNFYAFSMHVSGYFMHGIYFHACFMHGSYFHAFSIHETCMKVYFMHETCMEHAWKYKTCMTDIPCMKHAWDFTTPEPCMLHAWSPHYIILIRSSCFADLKVRDFQSARRGQISYLRGSESRTRKLIYTMGILYGRILTWRTEQVVNLSRRYVSATPARRLLSQELVETTILRATRSHFKSCPDVGCVKQLSCCCHYLQGSSFQHISEFLNIYLHACDGPKTWYRTSIP